MYLRKKTLETKLSGLKDGSQYAADNAARGSLSELKARGRREAYGQALNVVRSQTTHVGDLQRLLERTIDKILTLHEGKCLDDPDDRELLHDELVDAVLAELTKEEK